MGRRKRGDEDDTNNKRGLSRETARFVVSARAGGFIRSEWMQFHEKETAPAPGQSNLTPGMAKKTIVKGQTTQAEVVEVFGPPDLVTHRDDLQIWTDDKITYEIESSGSYFTVVIAGTGKSRASSSSEPTMLIIYFDAKDVVRDYRMNVAKF
jgi:hypothetical protein